MRIRCFVASAFSRDDVDQVFDSAICPVFAAMNLPKPIRVDREDHNDDIDDRIIKHIDECDFCIADISYARPSVYYEAGYVSGLKKDVIYIVEEGHLVERPDSDPLGNERIHFDLKMKNIITWKRDNLEPFKQKLRRRITTVLKPLREEALRREKESQEEEAFSALSRSERLDLLAKASRGIVLGLGYRKGGIPKTVFASVINHYARTVGDRSEDIYIMYGFRLTKRAFSHLSNEIISWLGDMKYICKVRLVFVSLDKLGPSVLSQTFYDWRPVNRKSLEKRVDDSIMGISVLDCVRSRKDFCERLSEILQNL